MDTTERHILYHTEPDRAGGGYRAALAQAIQACAGIHIENLPRRAGAVVSHTSCGHIIELDFLGRRAVIEMPDILIYYPPDRSEVPVWARILILHYLARANGAPRRGIDVTFRDLEGGREYFPAFAKRAISPLVLMFGKDPERFIEAGIAAGGVRLDACPFALRFRAFPRVDITLMLWPGDEEFPPSGSAIFDASIADYCSTEDVAVVCNMLAITICRHGKNTKED